MEVPREIEKEFAVFRNLAEDLEIADDNNNTIKLIIGDAFVSLDSLPKDYSDRVFFDPFSPGKQPEMWSRKVFQKVYNVMKQGAKLSTYSCAKSVRQNMIAAGFKVMDGPIVGRKSPSTIAVKTQNH